MGAPALHAYFRKIRASALLHLHQSRIRFEQWRHFHGLKLATFLLLAVAASAVVVLPPLQRLAGGYFCIPENLATLKSLLGGTGSALIGSATIAFSLVVFAMQINVERMPHGLFRQLSSDRRLLFSFLGSFLVALLIAGASLLPSGTWAVPAIFGAVWGVAAIVLLFIYAYRRALQIINPVEQLSIMSGVASRDLQKWSHLSELAAIAIGEAPQLDADQVDAEARLNEPKTRFFMQNGAWDAEAKRAIHYAIAYTKRFAAQGDYEVADNAFRQIIEINAAYCEAKRGTFIATNLFIDVPGTTDGFINTTLEHLRQTMQAALTGNDERLAQSTLRTLAALYAIYLQIEYPGLNPTKHHAMLASGYLANAVETVAPRELPDVMMEGIRQMGRGARVALECTTPTEIISLVQKIGTLSSVGALKKSHQPVTLVAFEQLSLITYDLLTKGQHDIDYTVREIRTTVITAAKLFLLTADTPLSSTHCSTLGPYFSVTQATSLLAKLNLLANQLLAAPEGNEHAARIIENLEEWANQIYDPLKDLLLFAVEKRSHFTFDAINWIIEISNLLNAISNAAATSDHVSEELRKHASWLVSTLSWLPDDRETVTFVETFSLTDSLFNAAVEGYRRDCRDFYLDCQSLLLSWAKKGGRLETGWGILERSIKGLIALAIEEGTPDAVRTMKQRLGEMLTSVGAPQEDARVRAAAGLDSAADQLGQRRAGSSIDRALARLDHAQVGALLREIAIILAP
ncbi:hypothetical protein QQ994_14240 [Pseudomonas asiatica]|uniref:hypothetical protein n=1 Tax=Pseudomonas asiatica TaxID=2219225 RepID=UPI00256FCBB6|nr:hypothetical protein [Pseudomonas asiatica]WJD67800.1 hypothetical protein QQ994_14240 [Pseudomonas asiatica]